MYEQKTTHMKGLGESKQPEGIIFVYEIPETRTELRQRRDLKPILGSKIELNAKIENDSSLHSLR